MESNPGEEGVDIGGRSDHAICHCGLWAFVGVGSYRFRESESPGTDSFPHFEEWESESLLFKEETTPGGCVNNKTYCRETKYHKTCH